MKGNQKNTKRPIRLRNGLVRLGLLLSCLIFSWGTALYGQTLACNGTPNAPLNVGVDSNCDAEIYADMVLEGPNPGVYTLVAMTLGGNLIVQGPEPIYVPGIYLGQTIAVTVIDNGSGNQCTGYMELMDNLAPVFVTCPTIDVTCSSNLSPNSLGYPNVYDNCDANFQLSYFDQMVGPDCNIAAPYIGYVTRTWVAVDASGNTSQCQQSINLLKAVLGDVVFPANYFSTCENPTTDPFITGMPEIDGNEIMTGGYCQMITSYQDNIVYSCLPATHSYLVLRTWTVYDECEGTFSSDQQVITVGDNTGPAITCPAPITISAASDICAASFFIPLPSATDNCSPTGNLDYNASASFGGVGFGPFLNIPVGSYSVTYSATDECGNMSTCNVSLNVVDDVPPTAICDEFTVVSINSLGEAIVPAINLDDGSYDNCSQIVFTASRNGGATFAPFITFDCDDVGMSIDVILRVTETNNSNSYNDCAVVVNVMDNIDPVIVCPQNEVSDCLDNSSDLSVFGFPVVLDNCDGDYTITSDSTFNLNTCGEGSIIRHFYVVDGSGNTDDCTQYITIENMTPYDGSTINWPDDITLTNACIAPDELDPEDLPTINGFPIIPNAPCTMPAWNYSDQLFYVNYPGCYKIIRTWTVMDWCSYDPNYPNNGGIWYHTQIIKLEDTQAPVLTVSGMISASAGPNCGPVYVSIPAATATDCNSSLFYSNNSPYADANGPDASGVYPLGQTLVTYSVSDGCGNVATATVLVKVEDNSPPSPTCIDLVTELSDMGPAGITVPVNPNLLLLEALDNCTPEANIGVFIQPEGASGNPPSTTIWNFTCDDVGPNEMEIWVVDEAGNADYCVITIIIQDNFVTCPVQNTVATIAGFVENEDGDMIMPTQVSISGNQGTDEMQTDGDFIFDDLPTGYDYSVNAQLDTDPTNGVTTYDLVLISKHILGVDLLDSPYKMIAADANNSGTVSTLDMVDITKVILFMESSFPNNTSWRFVDADYVFPTNPLSQPYPEVLNYNNLDTDDLEANFIGVKIGDVNNSADTDLLDNVDDRNVDGYQAFAIEDLEMTSGNTYEVHFYPALTAELAAWQFTLDYNPATLDLQGVKPGKVPGLMRDNFAMIYPESGLATAAWFSPDNVVFDASEPIFTATFTALRDGSMREALDLNSKLTAAEAYGENGERFDLGLTFRTGDVSKGYTLSPNSPNPFSISTTLSWYFPEATEATLEVFDVTGRTIYSVSEFYEAGKHEQVLDREMFPNGGTYFYRIETENFSATRRMILLDSK
ncbi:MAG: T9SS type A sorting domain-containing protein [Saprospiraceae bacterium]|nr:T9SS type A sorting domain-containing protein [Saprospiraceae bacterium]